MIHFLKFNSLISNNQHGFLKCKSTATNLLECLNDWTKSVDNKLPVDIIYIDLAKAFDSVSHRKLLYKLNKVGIGGSILTWFGNFLCNRMQCVRVNSTLSTFLPVGSGIGQGTILGPLLFILYVNDITSQISNNTVKLYADDAKLYGNSANDHQCGQIQHDLNRIEGYLNDWQHLG